MKKNLPECPVATFLTLVGNKWKILIIRDLLSGTKRFKELQRSIGCSQKVLTDNLRELEKNGLISRKVYAEVPPRVEYSMTKTGNSISPVLDSIAKWGTEYKKR
ncbi:MAG: helix-turn-helix transcriptional regulator [Alphaproteobacteria bacterium]|nr:helix-turn-helix transcriptional regulator [Alphaproteobacteria bacterium]